MKEKNVKNIFIDGSIPAQKIADDLQKHATRTEIGAHSIFLGQVRADEKAEGKVIAIDYTAYEEMALTKMQEIRETIFSRYPLTCMHVYHSLGRVLTGEICLFVFVSSRHRKAAMEACEELVEAIKNQLPIWGKEILDTAGTIWKENT
ncbi:MAG: molybdenum cofactor biosynthesis protein MoaE [Bacteroidota bacterium]|nr:molybdenum cofactor biosynthesis protein MoaE [Bacteroidota bacterium]